MIDGCATSLFDDITANKVFWFSLKYFQMGQFCEALISYLECAIILYLNGSKWAFLGQQEKRFCEVIENADPAVFHHQKLCNLQTVIRVCFKNKQDETSFLIFFFFFFTFIDQLTLCFLHKSLWSNGYDTCPARVCGSSLLGEAKKH